MPDGSSASYGVLLEGSRELCRRIQSNPSFERGGRVAFIARPGVEYVQMLLGTWQAGGVAVPLCISHPSEELRYAITEADACLVASSSEFAAQMEQICTNEDTRLLHIEVGEGHPPIMTSDSDDDGHRDDELMQLKAEDDALIIFTSGTTGRPKGVVLTHGNLQAHTTSLVHAWGWTPTDRILHILPLHHLHGLGNKLLCALWAGASVAFSSPTPRDVWTRLGNAEAEGLTLFMAVPTNYALLLREAEREGAGSRLIRDGAAGAASLRLMVSGSMALPTPVLQKWCALTGHTLLERYGMTELGMALSNPLDGERVIGSVGRPLPGVECELRDPSTGAPLDAEGSAQGGELLVRGPGVFKEYFRRPEATAKAFADGGWFRTGDHASRDAEGIYRILGRASVDVIKSAGYKISALEVERALLAHESVEEVAVVGIESEAFGQLVGAIVVPASIGIGAGAAASEASDACENAEALLARLRADCADELAAYKLPTAIRVVSEIKKNPMGKVNKKALVDLFM